MDNERNVLQTVAEQAKRSGRKVGIDNKCRAWTMQLLLCFMLINRIVT